MKNKIFKTSVILVIILTMTMTNFIFVGANLVSYAADNIATNHKNVDFEAYFKEKEKDALFLRINIKQEGYFNGEVTLGDSNFTFKEAESTYVSKVEKNKLYLNQMNAGIVEEIKVKIEPMKEESFSVGMLDMVSKVSINGIYRDSTQRDIKIQANRDVSFQMPENNTAENVQNEMKIITNKIMEIDGIEKRVLQLSYHMGLKDNNYPMQEIIANVTIPEIEGKKAKIEKIEQLNNMTVINEQYGEENVELTLRNEANSEGKANWKKQGDENVILTCLYDKEVNMQNLEIKATEKIRLYNGKELEAENRITVGEEEINNSLEVSNINAEEVIYKGKLNAGLDRLYQTTTQLKVNLAKVVKEIVVEENNSQEGIGVTYHRTTIRKEQFDKILGENGTMEIFDQNGEIIETIANETAMNEEGNIVIDYTGREVTAIRIETTAPVEEGVLELNHSKIARANGEAEEIKSNIIANEAMVESTIKLENAITKATLEVDKESLSTVVKNDVEMKVVLTSNTEQYNLFQNPVITIEMPEEVEEIIINKMDLLYEEELRIKDYTVNGRTILVTLEGEQTQYKEDTVEGAMIVIDAAIGVNKKATTQDKEIKMTYKNQEEGMDSKAIKIVAPTDITTIHSVSDLGIETIGQEEKTQVMIARAGEERNLETQIEIINNNKEAVENVKVLGEFPTNHEENNLNTEILAGIDLENAKIYYTENAKATDEIENPENAWTETITDSHKVSKYLMVIDRIESQSSVQGNYAYKVPGNLDYNQAAKTGYVAKYTNSDTKVENELAATTIEMTTGIGPKVETRLMATVGGKDFKEKVKNGEVIRYRIEVSNVGTEEAQNVQVLGKVPEGTTMVVPEEKYEYTGASYYQELDNKTYETTIENLKAGQVVYAEYEVRVNSQVEEGTILTNQAEVKYGDITKQTEEIRNETEKGNLRVSVKRITDRKVDLYENGVVQYFAIIENISNEKQENVKVQTHLPKNLEVEMLTLYNGMEEEQDDIYLVGSGETMETVEEPQEPQETTSNDNIQSQPLEYKEEIDIGSLQPGETKVLSYDMLINKMQDDNKSIDFSVTVKNKKEQYESNNWKDKVNEIEVGISMTNNTESQYVKSGDEIEYTIVVENKSNAETTGLMIKDEIPSQLTIDEILQDGQRIEEIEGNDIEIPVRIGGNETSTITIKAIVDYSEARARAEAITNIAIAEVFGERVATTTEINHIIQSDETDNDDGPEQPGEDDDNKDNDNKNDPSDVAKGDKTITGVAWFDENANGRKEQGEKLLSDIKVKLLNTKTNRFVKEDNGQILEATTNENGVYVLDKIGDGKYIVVFDYDDTKYALTKYKVEGITEAENSNAILGELLIENNKEKVASTDIIEVQENPISNINIGLIKLQNFDLKLDKQVSKILIQNAKGTTVREYDNVSIAKVELDAKTVNGSMVIIEYKIRITNNGEIEGYAKKIADYAATDLKFSSELNKDWYQVGDTLYTASLANEKIKPGETKTVTLTLTKAMTENNTGLVANTAEIAEDYNELGIADSNSTPGNRAKGENDFGLAEVAISIRTGAILYTSIGIGITAILAVAVVVIIKNKKEEIEE